MASSLAAWRRAFPALAVRPHGRRLAYLDSAATALKPQAVIDAVTHVFTHAAGSVHRGVHALADAATTAFDAVRPQVARFLGGAPDEIVFTSGATEALNLLAQAWGGAHVGPGDAVVVSALEHHANLVPWQQLCAARGATLRVAPLDAAGRIDLAATAALLDDRVKVVAVSHLSNVLGTIAPIAALAALAHAVGAILVVDGAQAVAHLPVDVAALGCDAYVFSAHKLFGPPGVGVLWARAALLAATPPWKGGGEMIASVTDAGARYRDPPYRFEAGTPNIAGVIGLGAALAFWDGLDHAARHAHEAAVHAGLLAALRAIDGVTILGAPEAAVVAFTVAGAHPHDVATIVDQHGVAIRSGRHCAEPLHHRLGVDASARASIALYSGEDDVAQLVAGLHDVREVFR